MSVNHCCLSASPVIASDYTPLHLRLGQCHDSIFSLQSSYSCSSIRCFKQYNVHEKVPQQIFMLVIMVCFKLYATVSRSVALIGDVSVALVQLQPGPGSRCGPASRK